MKYVPVDTIKKAGITPVLARKERLLLVSAAYREVRQDLFKAPEDLENPDVAHVRATSSLDTAMQPAVDALNRAGQPTDASAGGLMDSLGLDQETLHEAFCFCHEPLLAGYVLADFFHELAKAA